MYSNKDGPRDNMGASMSLIVTYGMIIKVHRLLKYVEQVAPVHDIKSIMTTRTVLYKHKFISQHRPGSDIIQWLN